jgi:hypothetical protein
MNSSRIRLLCLGVALVWAFTATVQKAHAQSTSTPWQRLTQSQLTAVWWQWALSLQVSDSALFDDAGTKAFIGQPYSDLLFLCGTITITQLANGNVLGEVTRSITVEQGTAFFFPLLNTEFDNVCGTPHLGVGMSPCPPAVNVLSIPELRAMAAAQQDFATLLHATLTPTDSLFQATGPSVNVSYARLLSPPFSFALPATDNLYQFFGVNISGRVAPAVSDGYWSFLQGTLAPGYYTLQFGGTLPLDTEGHTFTQAITYHIRVTTP